MKARTVVHWKGNKHVILQQTRALNGYLEGRGQHSTLEGTSSGHSLILVEGGGGSLLEHLLNEVLDGRDAGRATDNLHTGDVVQLQVGVREALLKGVLNTLQQVGTHLLHGSSVEG